MPGQPRVGRETPLRARPARATPRCAPRCAKRPGQHPTADPATCPPSTATCCARFGKKGQTRAIFAVGHSILVIAWHLLANDSTYDDLGGDHFDPRNDTEARKRYLVRQLEALGHKVTLEPAAA